MGNCQGKKGQPRDKKQPWRDVERFPEPVPDGEMVLTCTEKGENEANFTFYHRPLGLQVGPDNRSFEDSKLNTGCLITKIDGAPAQTLGMRKGMVVTHLNGRPIDTMPFTEISALFLQGCNKLAKFDRNTSDPEKRPEKEVAAAKQLYKDRL